MLKKSPAGCPARLSSEKLVVNGEGFKILNPSPFTISLLVNNDLLHNLSEAVFKDHGINAVWHGPQVDHLLQGTVHLHLCFFIDLHTEAVVNADGEEFL